CYLRTAHVAADHPFGQARLECLIDDATAPAEIWFAASNESLKWHLLRSTAALGVKHPDRHVHVRHRFHLPDALASVPAVLLEDAWARRLEARGELGAQGVSAVVSMRVSAPAQVTRTVKHLLDAHLQYDVGSALTHGPLAATSRSRGSSSARVL